jgi:hypothetical protein
MWFATLRDIGNLMEALCVEKARKKKKKIFGGRNSCNMQGKKKNQALV